MLHIDRILFPTDGSACAARAYQHAVDVADRHQADLHVLHVEERTIEWSDVIDIRTEDVLADLHAPLPDTDADTSLGHTEQHTITHPSAAHGILVYAAEHDIDLIVMGTHGRRGLARAVIGSVAEEVIRRAECPVLTIRANEDVQNMPSFDHLLVPVDFSTHTEGLVQHAEALALAYDVPVHLLHVIEQLVLPTAYGIQPPEVDLSDMRVRAREAFQEYVQRLEADGVETHVHLRDGHAAREILNTVANSSRPPLLVVATHGRTGLKRMLLGSIAEKVVRRAQCPVFTVKPYGRTLVDPRLTTAAADATADATE